MKWKKFQSTPDIIPKNPYLIIWSYYLINRGFQGVNRIFVLAFESNTDRTGNTGCYLPKVETKDYIVPSRQILVPGRPEDVPLQRPHVPNWHPGDNPIWRPGDVPIWPYRDVPWEHSGAVLKAFSVICYMPLISFFYWTQCYS